MTKEEWDRECDAARPKVKRQKGGVVGGTQTSTWPMKCLGMAVHPSLRQEAVDDAKAKGVPTDFTLGGRPIYTDAAHRDRYLKAYGRHDNNGGYRN